MRVANNDLDTSMRIAAFEHLSKLGESHDPLTSADIKSGFQFQGERIPLANPQRGIFKPRQMQYLLSIRTVFPRPGARVWYDDQKIVHRQLFAREETAEYSFMGRDPEAADNQWLREAFERQIPVVYLLGIAPARYLAVVPTFISSWDSKLLSAQISFGLQGHEESHPPQNAIERRYGLRIVKQRLHQASFREAVIAAYNGRCALSRLPEAMLLDAAHIVEDAHEELGQPVVSNGIPFQRIITRHSTRI